MAEGQSSSSSGSAPKRRKRRRPSRKRRKPSGGNQQDAQSKPQSKSGQPQSSTRRNRRRRRRKSRSRSSATAQGGRSTQGDMLDARLSENVFVYTHVLRSAELDTYGFRSDPFLNSSRGLGDFRVDLTALYPDGPDVDTDTPIFDSALHGPIVTQVLDDESETSPHADDAGTDALVHDGVANDNEVNDSAEGDAADAEWLEDVQRAVNKRDEEKRED